MVLGTPSGKKGLSWKNSHVGRLPPVSELPCHIKIKAGLLPSPCFPNFLARTTFVLVSLSEVKIPGQDAIFGDFVFTSSNLQER